MERDFSREQTELSQKLLQVFLEAKYMKDWDIEYLEESKGTPLTAYTEDSEKIIQFELSKGEKDLADAVMQATQRTAKESTDLVISIYAVLEDGVLAMYKTNYTVPYGFEGYDLLIFSAEEKRATSPQSSFDMFIFSKDDAGNITNSNEGEVPNFLELEMPKKTSLLEEEAEDQEQTVQLMVTANIKKIKGSEQVLTVKETIAVIMRFIQNDNIVFVKPEDEEPLTAVKIDVNNLTEQSEKVVEMKYSDMQEVIGTVLETYAQQVGYMVGYYILVDGNKATLYKQPQNIVIDLATANEVMQNTSTQPTIRMFIAKGKEPKEVEKTKESEPVIEEENKEEIKVPKFKRSTIFDK